MRPFGRHLLLVALLLVFMVPPIFGQATTGSLTGKVTSEGNPLPGVTVTISSRSLQGTRSDTTGEAGGYHFPSLPPGDYTVTFELSGMQPIRKHATVNLAQTSSADAELRVSAVAEAMTVTAAAPAVAETTEVSANFKVQQINELPVDRDIRGITLLAPGVTDAGPRNQITISGSQSYENLFLVDGVVVNENLRGQPNPVYIEDAIQETTILTGGVSAEFGRFTGGVVSTVTKSGGNEYSGTFRDSLTNPDWTKKTEFAAQVDPLDDINNVYEGTLGGRILRDRLWFFTAGRYQKTDARRQTTQTNIPYLFEDTDRRYEGKLTAQITQSHSLVGFFTGERDKSVNSVSNGRVVDIRSLVPFDRPRSLMAFTYNGVVAKDLLLEGHFSRMQDRFTNGAENRDPIEGTMLLDASSGNRMWSATFCGSPCPAKQRNNKEWLGKASYFLSTRATGNHSLVGGYDEFHQLRNENNYQSGSDFRIHGRIIQVGSEVFFGTDTDNGEIEYDPVPALSHTSDFAVRSVFLNDKWELNNHWGFNVGVRYDKAFGSDQAGNKTVDDSAISPRLAATFDLGADGKNRFSATYGRYVSKVDQGPADNTATAGRYASYYWDYKGPVINPPGTPTSQLVPTASVIKQVFDWFNSVGGTKNTTLLTSAHIPGVTLRFDKSLNAPWMDEYTLGYSRTFGSSGYVRTDLVTRKWGDFYVVRRTIETGKARDPNGTLFDQGVIENSSDGLSRNYRALQLQGSYRAGNAFTVGGNYTYSKLKGNLEGETTNATSITGIPDRPEYTGFDENQGTGLLGPDMRHRGNLWLRYEMTTPVGRLNASLLQRYHSGLTYSALGLIDVRASSATGTGPVNGVVNPGYTTVPSSVNYYFGDRGDFQVESVKATDLGLNWYIPSLRGISPFIEVDIINVFNGQAIEDPDFVDKTVLTRRNATCLQSGTSTRCAAFNPLAGEQPTEGTHWQKGANFGKPTGVEAYQLPRTYRFSLGLRF